MDKDVIKEFLEKVKLELGNEKIYKIIPSLMGPDTLVLKDNETAYFHSKYDPTIVARNFGIKIQKEANKAIAFAYMGLGLGYEVIEIFKYTNSERPLIIYENNYELIERFLNSYDLEDIKEDGKLIITYTVDSFIGELQKYVDVNNVVGLKHYYNFSFKKYLSESYDQVYPMLEKSILGMSINRNTLISNRIEWFINSRKNIPVLFESKLINRAGDTFKGVPAIIVAAGPSLKENIEFLRQAKGKFLIICVNTAYMALVKNNIEPDFVCAIDGKDFIAQPYEGMRIEAPIIYAMQVNPKFMKLCDRETVLLTTDGCTTVQNILLDKNDVELSHLDTGGSVANTTYSIFTLLGCDPIVFVGQDLAFSGDYTHSKDSGQSKGKVSELDKNSITSVKGNSGEMLKTSVQYKSYLQWFEAKIKLARESGSKTEYINTSINGAHIEGTKVMALEEVVSKYGSNIDVLELVKEFLNSSNIFDDDEKKEAYFILKNYHSQYVDLKEKAEDGIKFSDKLIEAHDPKKYDEKKINYLVNKLNRIDEKIKNYNELLQLSATIFSAISIEFYTPDMTDLTEDQKILEKNKNYYFELARLGEICNDEFQMALNELNNTYGFEEV